MCSLNERQLSTNISDHSSKYLHSLWSDTLSALNRGLRLTNELKADLSYNEKEAIKSVFKDFNNSFDKVLQQSKKSGIISSQLIETLMTESVKLILTNYKSFYERTVELYFSSNPSKYATHTVCDLESGIQMMFINSEKAIISRSQFYYV